MSQPPAFQLYAADFYMDTISWSNEEIGIYFRLLMCEWVNGPLPFEVIKLRKICQVSAEKWQKKWPKISEKFKENGQGNLINIRLEKTRVKALKYIESQKESGKRGAEKKRELGIYPFNKPSDPLSDPSRQPLSDPATQNQALQSSSSIKDKDPKKEPFQLPTKEEINESSMPKIKQDLDKICEHLYETGKFPKVHAFKNKMLKEGKYERAILHTLIRCSLKDVFEDTPWGYCHKIIEVENGNYNEYEYGKDKG